MRFFVLNHTLLWVISLFIAVPSLCAVDLQSLDSVSVMMPKSKVLSILGAPSDMGDLGNGLKVDIYDTKAVDSMIASGAIYDKNGMLIGMSFIFKGAWAKTAAGRIRDSGFSLLEAQGHSYKLSGLDDDTGIPLIVYITEEGEITTVFTFEKKFYEDKTGR